MNKISARRRYPKVIERKLHFACCILQQRVLRQHCISCLEFCATNSPSWFIRWKLIYLSDMTRLRLPWSENIQQHLCSNQVLEYVAFLKVNRRKRNLTNELTNYIYQPDSFKMLWKNDIQSLKVYTNLCLCKHKEATYYWLGIGVGASK